MVLPPGYYRPPSTDELDRALRGDVRTGTISEMKSAMDDLSPRQVATKSKVQTLIAKALKYYKKGNRKKAKTAIDKAERLMNQSADSVGLNLRLADAALDVINVKSFIYFDRQEKSELDILRDHLLPPRKGRWFSRKPSIRDILNTPFIGEDTENIRPPN